MRNDGRDEETPNKKRRSHSSGTPMQSPEQNTSFAEMFANIGATRMEAPTVEAGMMFPHVFCMEIPVPRTFPSSPAMVTDEGSIPREIWEDADKMRREVGKLMQKVDELRFPQLSRRT